MLYQYCSRSSSAIVIDLNILHVDLRGLQTISERSFTAWHFAQARSTMPCILSGIMASPYTLQLVVGQAGRQA